MPGRYILQRSNDGRQPPPPDKTKEGQKHPRLCAAKTPATAIANQRLCLRRIAAPPVCFRPTESARALCPQSHPATSELVARDALEANPAATAHTALPSSKPDATHTGAHPETR